MKHRRIGNLALALSFSFLGSVSAFAIGQSGLKALAENDIPRAHAEYYKEYVAYPGHPLAIFNWADALHQQGKIEEADRLYSQAAQLGQTYIPAFLIETHDATTTVRDVSCRYLAQDRKADPNCPPLRADAGPLPPLIAAAPPPPPVASAGPAVRNFAVFFDFNRAELTSESRQVIASAVETAKKAGAVRITVTGHADTVGSQSYNQRLSERRAEAVKSEMMRLGMSAADIGTIGRGFNDPLIPTGPGAREPKNRRAMIDLGTPAVAGNF